MPKEYIEREAMLKYIDENIFRMKPNKEGKHPIAIETIRNFIATFDTADVVPVKRGEWQDYHGIFRCSECGYSFEHEGYKHFFHFCPNCGADMSNT